MLTIENQILKIKESVIDFMERINLLEIQLIKDELKMTLEETESKIEQINIHVFELARHSHIDKETLFYARLVRAKIEEILDIIELKRAM